MTLGISGELDSFAEKQLLIITYVAFLSTAAVVVHRNSALLPTVVFPLNDGKFALHEK